MKIYLSFLVFVISTTNILCQCNFNGQLPSSFPSDPNCLEAANSIIAHEFAPTIHQLVEDKKANSVGGVADLIVPIDYDGDFNTGNNWENLWGLHNDLPNTPSALNPKIYYSVVWVSNAWIVTYGIYHARDYASDAGACCSGVAVEGILVKPGDNHENDFEGVIIVVSRNSKEVVGGYSTFHEERKEYTDITDVPVVFIDNRTHAIELNLSTTNDIASASNPCDDGPQIGTSDNHVVYSLAASGVPSLGQLTRSAENDDFLTGTGEYVLEDVFSSSPNSLKNLEDNSLVFNGNIFHSSGTGGCEDNGSPAKAPWGWEQFDYSNELIRDVVCESMFDNSFQCTQSPPAVIHNPYNDPECGEGATWILTIDDEFTIDNVDNFTVGGYIVESGGTLTIKDSEIFFKKSGFIDVKEGGHLIIDNSTLDKCGADKWQGIKLRSSNGFLNGGFSSSGEITIRNVSYIKNAEVGLTVGDLMTFDYERKVNINQALFLSNSIGIVFNSGYGNTILESVGFVNYATNIKMIGALGVKIQKAGFHAPTIPYNEPGFRHIDAFNSRYQIEDDVKFAHGDIGIANYGMWPFSSSSIIGNMNTAQVEFDDTWSSIYSLGTDYPGGVVAQNVLFGGFGTHFYGINNFNLKNNDFLGSGVYTEDVGGLANSVDCNVLNRSSLFFEGDNSNTMFLGNSFDNSSTESDVYLKDHELAPVVGSSSNPAGNCFADVSADFTELEPGSDFTYYFYSQGVDCEVPIQSLGYLPQPTENESNNCNNQIGVFGLINPNGGNNVDVVNDTLYDPDDACVKCIKDSINVWIDTYVNTGGDDPRTEINDGDPFFNENVFWAGRVMEEWINYGLYVAIQTGNDQMINDILIPLKQWKWQSILFGIRMNQHNFTDANSILNTLQTNDLNKAYFKDIQELNIKHMSDIGDGSNNISQQDLDLLEFIANSSEPVKGYAASLYKYLTGVDLIDPNKRKSEIKSRSNESVVQKVNELRVSPNPATEMIEIRGGSDTYSSVRIYSTTGKLVKSTNRIDQSQPIDVSQLEQGLYIIVVTDIENKTYSSRFVKQ